MRQDQVGGDQEGGIQAENGRNDNASFILKESVTAISENPENKVSDTLKVSFSSQVPRMMPNEDLISQRKIILIEK